MPAFEVECDIAQGFELAPDRRHTVGYLTTLAIGGVTPDLAVTLPPPDAAQPVVAVLSGGAWSTAAADDLTLRGRLSPANAARLREIPRESPVQVGFVVFTFDHINGVYFRAFESYRGFPASGVGQPGTVYGILTKATGNQDVELTIAPPRGPQRQQIMIHPSAATKLIMPWGV